jgi:hypothetical protein
MGRIRPITLEFFTDSKAPLQAGFRFCFPHGHWSVVSSVRGVLTLCPRKRSAAPGRPNACRWARLLHLTRAHAARRRARKTIAKISPFPSFMRSKPASKQEVCTLPSFIGATNVAAALARLFIYDQDSSCKHKMSGRASGGAVKRQREQKVEREYAPGSIQVTAEPLTLLASPVFPLPQPCELFASALVLLKLPPSFAPIIASSFHRLGFRLLPPPPPRCR